MVVIAQTLYCNYEYLVAIVFPSIATPHIVVAIGHALCCHAIIWLLEMACLLLQWMWWLLEVAYLLLPKLLWLL